MTDTTRRPITVDMPGAFDAYFEGSSIGQGTYDEPAAEELGAAYTEAVTIKRGRSYSLRMTMTVEAAWLLLTYTALPAEARASDEEFTPAEIKAARTLRDRLRAALKEHYSAEHPVGSTIVTPDGPGEVESVSVGDRCAYFAARTTAGYRHYREDELVTEAPAAPEVVDLDNTEFGTTLVSPTGARLLLVDAGDDARGPFVWLLPLGENGFQSGARRRKLRQDEADGWMIKAEV